MLDASGLLSVCCEANHRHAADVPHLVPVFLPRIYTIDTWQPEEVCLCACTLDGPSPIKRYLDECPCPW